MSGVRREELRAALVAFVRAFEDPQVHDLSDLNDAYEQACEALGIDPKEIEQ